MEEIGQVFVTLGCIVPTQICVPGSFLAPVFDSLQHAKLQVIQNWGQGNRASFVTVRWCCTGFQASLLQACGDMES